MFSPRVFSSICGRVGCLRGWVSWGSRGPVGGTQEAPGDIQSSGCCLCSHIPAFASPAGAAFKAGPQLPLVRATVVATGLWGLLTVDVQQCLSVYLGWF